MKIEEFIKSYAGIAGKVFCINGSLLGAICILGSYGVISVNQVTAFEITPVYNYWSSLFNLSLIGLLFGVMLLLVKNKRILCDVE